MVKVLKLVKACMECTHRRSGSGGSACSLVDDTPIADPTRIPAFCSLTDYPAAKIAGLEKSVAWYQADHTDNFGVTLLKFMAAQLKLPLSAYGGIDIPTKRDGTISFRLDQILEGGRFNPLEILFMSGDDTFRLSLNGVSSSLQKKWKGEVPGHEGGELWAQCDIGEPEP